MGFLDDLLGAGEDLFTSTFDPEYGLLGRPAAGALRSVADIGMQLDPTKYAEKLAWSIFRDPYTDEMIRRREENEAKARKVLDRTLGAGLGTKMIGEPTQQMAEAATGAKGTFPELFRAAVAPERLPGDISETVNETIMGPQGPITTSRATTPEDVKTMMEASKQVGGAAESVGGLIEQAPELMAIPAAPGLGMAFLPGAAESLGANIGTGQYGKAAIDALFLTMLGKSGVDLAGGGRPTTSEVKQSEPVLEAQAPRRTDVGAEDITNLVRSPEEISHLDKAKQATSSFVDTIKNDAADLLGVERLRETKTDYIPGTNTMWYDGKTNTIYMDPDLLLREGSSRIAEDVLHELSHPSDVPEGISPHEFGKIKYTGEMVPGEKFPVAEKTGVAELPSVPREGPAGEYEIDAGELGLTPEQLTEAGPTVEFDPALIEHTYGNMAERAKFLPGENLVHGKNQALLNKGEFTEARQKLSQELFDINRSLRGETGPTGHEKLKTDLARIEEERTNLVRGMGDKTINELISKHEGEPEFNQLISDLKAEQARRSKIPAGEEAQAPKAKLTKAEQIERDSLEKFVFEQNMLLKEYADNFQKATTEAGKKLASRNFREAKEYKDRATKRIAELGGQAETRAARAEHPEAIDVEAKVVSEPVQETPKQITAPEPTPKEIGPAQTEVVVSAPAHNLRRLLEGMGLTRFNVNKLPETLKAAGLEVPPELTARLPELIAELKERGWVNEKIGGTYTLQTSPPKGIVKGKLADVTNVTEQLKKSVGAESVKEARNEGPLAAEPVEELTPAQIREQKRREYAASKGIELPPKEARAPEREVPVEEDITIDTSSLDKAIEAPPGTPKKGEPLTPDEIKAIAKLFGEETKPRKGTKETPQEVLDAQKAALRGLVEREKKGGEGLPPTEEVGEGPSRMYDVTLSDGTTHKVKASTPEEAKTRAEEVLTEYKSTKKVDKVEPSLSTLEKAAKYEIEPVKEAGEQISDVKKGIKSEQKAEVQQAKKLGKEEEKLRTAQRKEEFEEKPFTVNLSNGRVVTVRARNEKVARANVEARIKAKKSGVTIEGIAEKPSALDEAITGAARKLEESGFINNPIVRVLNAVKSITFGGDVGHLLRQGKQMNADLLFSKHAKKVVQQFPELWRLAKGGMKGLESLNEKLYADKDIRMMVDDFGLDMPGMGKGLKEEAFHGAGLAEKLPVIGKHYVERSEAVYTGGLNYLRGAEVKKFVESLRKDGFTPDNAPEKYAAVARALNIISQRGSFGPAYQKLFSDASAVFGAPRAKAARLQNALELFKGGTSGKIVRTTAAKTLGFNLALYGLLKSTLGATFVTDDESSDFGKIRINKKITVDPWMGLGVTARSVAKLIEGKSKSPYKTTKNGEPYEYPVKPSDVITQEFLGGTAPGIKLAWEMFTGTDLRGFQVERLSSLGNVAPLTWKSIVELAEAGDLDEAIELSMLQAAGEGVDVFDYEAAQELQRRLKLERGLSVGKKKGRRVYPF